MSQAVMEKARELARHIQLSPEYICMRAAEDAASQDEALAALSREYEEKRREVESLTLQDDPDYEVMMALSHELEDIQARYNALPLAQAVQPARRDFTQMMNEVNAELQKVLAPDAPAASCSGRCGGCAGCR